MFQWFYFTSSYTRKVLFYSLCHFIPDFATALTGALGFIGFVLVLFGMLLAGVGYALVQLTLPVSL